MGSWIRQRLKQYVLEIDLNFMSLAEMSSTSSIGETDTPSEQETLESRCSCKGTCTTNQCGCQRKNLPCGDNCHPKNKKCQNIALS
jgi:hypothetical protein